MAVTRADKEDELQQLEAAFKGSDSAILVDYKGLNVPQVTELRRQLRAAKASYKVVKNTLAKIAATEAGIEGFDDLLTGPTAIAFINGDVVEAVDADNLHYLSSAQLTCELVQSDPEAFGVLICGTGMGMSIAANKFRGIYAARCMSGEDAELSRAINNANVVCLAAKSGFSENRQIIDTFVRTTYTGRKLEQLETIAHFELEASPAPSVPIAAVLRDVRRTA